MAIVLHHGEISIGRIHIYTAPASRDKALSRIGVGDGILVLAKIIKELFWRGFAISEASVVVRLIATSSLMEIRTIRRFFSQVVQGCPHGRDMICGFGDLNPLNPRACSSNLALSEAMAV